MTASQSAAILAHLRTHREGITPIEALRLFGCMRLAARISDIKDGMLAADEVIDAELEDHDGGRHARYRLRSDARLFRDVPEWDRYRDSPHARHGHPKPLVGCEWCERWEVIDARFSGAPVPEPVAEGQESLWGDAA